MQHDYMGMSWCDKGECLTPDRGPILPSIFCGGRKLSMDAAQMPEDIEVRSCPVLVLLSGGIDSSAVVAFYLEKQCDLSCLFVDYGQAARSNEFQAAQKIVAHYRVRLRRVSCSGVDKKWGGEILGRNAFLLFIALMEFDALSGIIATGIHADTSYYDCSESFATSMKTIFNGYTNGRVRIGAPFLEWSKPDIWEFCQEQNVPIHMTYSCELGREQPCGECSSCKDLEALYARPKLDS